MFRDDNSNVIEVPLKTRRIQQISQLVYAQVMGKGQQNISLTMDLLVPRQRTRIPAVLFITGGQFIYANKDSCVQLRMSLAEAGYVVASINYRTAPQAVFPEPLQDVKAAIRYLRRRAEDFHIDSKRIAAVGESAGGYLAAMAGVTNGMADFDCGENLSYSSSVQAVVDLYGPSDLRGVGADFSPELCQLYHSSGAAEALWVNGIGAFGGIDGGVLADEKKTDQANPAHYITADAPPFLLMHGDQDQQVSPSQTMLLYQALREKNAEAVHFTLLGAGHGGIHWVQPAIFSIIKVFLEKHIGH